ncbi:hypothetical protein ABIE27_001506 [Paenibacillus sp. 4624]
MSYFILHVLYHLWCADRNGWNDSLIQRPTSLAAPHIKEEWGRYVNEFGRTSTGTDAAT